MLVLSLRSKRFVVFYCLGSQRRQVYISGAWEKSVHFHITIPLCPKWNLQVLTQPVWILRISLKTILVQWDDKLLLVGPFNEYTQLFLFESIRFRSMPGLLSLSKYTRPCGQSMFMSRGISSEELACNTENTQIIIYATAKKIILGW